MKKIFLLILSAIILVSCGTEGSKKRTAKKTLDDMQKSYLVHLITVDPGHFHAALVQKKMYDEISPDVYIYAPEGPDYQQHITRINSYNNREENPTAWNRIIYTGEDFLEIMLEEKAGNVVVLSGNNQKKDEYILRSLNAGLNVLADKPMIINPEDFIKLEQAYIIARDKNILLYDIMTERYEVTTILQKLISHEPEIFGELIEGSAEMPAVTKESVHHFSKMVSGLPLMRPAWFFDVEQQGEGLVDVTTHLVDLVQWECFPEEVLRKTDVYIEDAKRWPTVLSREQFSWVTGIEEFPDYLKKYLRDGNLHVYSNGEIIYKIKDVWAKVSVTWNFEAPQGGGDTHYSIMRGTGCDLLIKQGKEENFRPELYVQNIRGQSIEEITSKLKNSIMAFPYDSLDVKIMTDGVLKIIIPDRYRTTHEDHFGQVTEQFLKYMKQGRLPEWEEAGIHTKYYTTTAALKKARE